MATPEPRSDKCFLQRQAQHASTLNVPGVNERPSAAGKRERWTQKTSLKDVSTRGAPIPSSRGRGDSDDAGNITRNQTVMFIEMQKKKQ